MLEESELTVEKAYSKCWECIRIGEDASAEKDVYFFPKLLFCLCEKHLNEIVANHFGIKIDENNS